MSSGQRAPSECVRILDESGTVIDGAVVPDLTEAELVTMYRTMKLSRHFDQRAVKLQRRGQIATWTPLSGQEAAQVASVMALEGDDWLVPSYREHGAVYLRGVSLEETLQYWGGDERGNPDRDTRVLPVTIPIASQILHATGIGWAAQLQGNNDEVVLCYFGDGATSQGDFHEGLNFAGVFDIPAVYWCNNNQWAISVPRERQTASETIAQKATAYGFEGVQVDGMDPLAVYAVAKEAIEKARMPEDDEPRPTLVEAVQYRYGAHTTADDPTVYRDDQELERWKAKDPIPRLERHLRERGILDDARVSAITESIEDEVDEAIRTAQSYEPPAPASLFENVYEEMPPRLLEQLDYLEALREQFGDEVLLDDSS